MISVIFTGGSIFHDAGPILKATTYTLIAACCLIDIPISAVTDTIFLPWDFWKLRKERKAKNRIEQSVPGYPPQGVGSPEP